MQKNNIRPFVKWAGGKAQTLKDITVRLPKEIGQTINCYCEPFVGGGALLFELLHSFCFDLIIINDNNIELINAYRQIKTNVDLLISRLSQLQDEYYNCEDRTAYYYKQRDRFNSLILNGKVDINIEKASIFIFLNKTCFNGLFRVNKKGEFNVPIGNYKSPTICDSTNLKAISERLTNAKILCGDYYNCIDFIDNKTFVYLDPPYRPISKTSNFTSYTEKIFDDEEQVRLHSFIEELNAKGAKVLLSNSDPKVIDEDDNFFDDLFRDYTIDRIQAKRMINCNGERRNNISELLIRNYEVK